MLFAPGRPRALELWRRSGVDWGEDREPDGAPVARRVWVETEPRKAPPGSTSESAISCLAQPC